MSNWGLAFSFFVFLFFLVFSNFAWAALVSWSEVTRFTGSGDYTTDYFTCDHVEWRMNWNYTPISNYSTLAVFAVDVYPKNQNVSITSILQIGNTSENGTSYIHNQTGEFYLQFRVTNVENYTVVIEQDLESIPEFSLTILLSLFTTGIVVAMRSAKIKGIHLKQQE